MVIEVRVINININVPGTGREEKQVSVNGGDVSTI